MFERANTLINKKFRAFLIPTIISTEALSIAAIIDNILVGQFLSEKDLASIGTTSPFVFGLNMVALIFMIGGVITATTALGRHNKKEAQSLYTSAVTAGIIGTIFFQKIGNSVSNSNPSLREKSYFHVLEPFAKEVSLNR
jgi:Na+-driven multidrug efflux pump